MRSSLLPCLPLPVTEGLGRAKSPDVHGADRVRMLGMAGRALSFGAATAAYGRFRPGCPVELFDLVMAYAGRPGPRDAAATYACRDAVPQCSPVPARQPTHSLSRLLHRHVRRASDRISSRHSYLMGCQAGATSRWYDLPASLLSRKVTGTGIFERR